MSTIIKHPTGFNLNDIYWRRRGQHQALRDHLWKTLVPPRDVPPTIEGQLLLAISHLYFDFYSNVFSSFGTMEFLDEDLALLQAFQSELDIKSQLQVLTDFRAEKDDDLLRASEFDMSDRQAMALGLALEYIMSAVVLHGSKEQVKLGATA